MFEKAQNRAHMTIMIYTLVSRLAKYKLPPYVEAKSGVRAFPFVTETPHYEAE